MQPGAAQWSWALAIGVIATATQLVLVWGFEFFPSVDGPAHVHLAHGAYEALRGDSFYASLLEWNSTVSPNMATQTMMVALMAIAPPFVAEKIWLTLYFVSFAAAAAYALSGINRNALCLLPLLIFCSFSFPLAFGFYNFAFSTVVFLAWFGYWWRNRDRLGVGVTLGHALFAAAAYTTHVFAFVVTLLAIGLTGLTAIVQQMPRDGSRSLTQPRKWPYKLLSHALPPLLGSLPWLIACVHFLFFRFGSRTAAGAAGLTTAKPERIPDLLGATSFAPYDLEEVFPATAFVMAIVILLLFVILQRRRGSDFRASLPLAACFAGFLFLYLLMPERWIVRWMPSRFQPLVFIALLLWLAALLPASVRKSHWRMIGASGLALVFMSVAFKFGIFSRLDGYYREYASAAAHIKVNSTLIGLRLHDSLHGRPFPSKNDVFIQAGSRLASLRHSVELKNFQGQSDDHPVQFRDGVSATSALGGDPAITALPPRITLMEYERQTSRAIDYVLVYGFRDAVENKRGLERLDAQLRGHYELIHVSEPRGFVHLYARTAISLTSNSRTED